MPYPIEKTRLRDLFELRRWRTFVHFKDASNDKFSCRNCKFFIPAKPGEDRPEELCHRPHEFNMATLATKYCRLWKPKPRKK